ncbi:MULTISPECIES: FimV/HubP family polar landmark protein [unclassified Psychrobacter]|uniref:FimV/HubP family polar landmark protein n=1 Tax=unclassified Psychrobacter TaxID=196806 RepID=UPI0018F443F8|nr:MULTISPECIES: FimV/HubP family polar landmark protein [unclassified Psychrobacter]
MDTMLYLVVGLVVIVGIAFVVMRGKNKSAQSQTPATHQPSSTTNQRTPPVASEPVTKFDNETVAQRFIDQQRYDKAIETIDRGLAANPADSTLLLKLLHVYIATEQTDAFYQTYAKLERHADPVTMVQAQQLKAEVDREHAPMDTVPTTANPNAAAVEDTPRFGDFNFEVEEDAPATPVARTEPAPSTLATPEPAPGAHQNDDASFDLFLDDLNSTATSSATTSEPQPEQTSAAPEPQSEPEDDFGFTLDGLEASLTPETTNEPAQPVEEVKQEAPVDTASVSTTAAKEDLDFDFDSNVHSPTSPTSDLPAADTPLSSENPDDQKGTVDDDFTLDFESLLQDKDDNESTSEDVVPNHTVETVTNDEANQAPQETAKPQTQTPVAASTTKDSTSDEFADFNFFEDTSAPETANASNNDLAFDDDGALSLDIDGAETDADETIDFGITEAPVVENEAPVVDKTPVSKTDDAPMLFDDDFDFDAFESATLGMPVADDTTPVETTPITETAPTDTSLLPPTDDEFDFVKNLDSNQVTLELAEQYLSIGEYDGAKHLLNEVLAQGNSEQQQQAHTLLARTA